MSSGGPSPALKMIVYSMGVMLIGGTILFVVLMVQKFNDGSLFKKGSGNTVEAASCDDKKIDVRGRGILRNAELDGQQVKLWFADDSGNHHRLIIADSCSGAIVREVEVQVDKQ